jgi:hypothetical protein
MSSHRLDVPELHRRLDIQRRSLGLSWRGVGRSVGLPVSVFTRLSHGRTIEADALITLLVWLDLDNEIALLAAPGQQPIPCPTCGRRFQPKNDGTIRAHDCHTEAQP